jgi:hypothetical protein
MLFISNYMCFNLDAWNNLNQSGRLVGELIVEFRLLFVSSYWFVIVCLKLTGPTYLRHYYVFRRHREFGLNRKLRCC